MNYWIGIANKQVSRDDRLYDSIFHILKQKASCVLLFLLLLFDVFLFFAKGNNTIEWLIAARCVHATTQSILKIHQPASGFVSAGFKWWVMVR